MTPANARPVALVHRHRRDDIELDLKLPQAIPPERHAMTRLYAIHFTEPRSGSWITKDTKSTKDLNDMQQFRASPLW